jgi:hypothetical protein
VLAGSSSRWWHKPQLLAFKAIKAMIAQEVLLTYPDLNKPFYIKTDTSDHQLGAVIKQHGWLVAFSYASSQAHSGTTQQSRKSFFQLLKHLPHFAPFSLVCSSTSGLAMQT